MSKVKTKNEIVYFLYHWKCSISYGWIFIENLHLLHNITFKYTQYTYTVILDSCQTYSYITTHLSLSQLCIFHFPYISRDISTIFSMLFKVLFNNFFSPWPKWYRECFWHKTPHQRSGWYIFFSFSALEIHIVFKLL